MSEDTEETKPVGFAGNDATGEFFSVGTPLHAVRAGYIRRRADDLLYEAAVAGRYAHIIAPDRSGKTSLVSATAARLESSGVKVAILDLAQIGVREGANDAGRWYYNVAYRLLRQLRIRYDLQSWWQEKSILSNRQRLLEFYSEVILQSEPGQIVVFIDEIQCIGELPFADQLLASVRSAHNARTTDPDFTRLTFVMLGECDPNSLLEDPELSPFNATQSVPLDDFSREELNLFETELSLDADEARAALDRIYHWTRGQPYLTQKLARAVARDRGQRSIEEQIDSIVQQQLAGRAALHSEPHMAHIHRRIMASGKMTEPLLNMFGKLCKGVHVATDLGSAEQRRLIAIGLLEVDESGELRIRNRIYAAVFTTRWANENLPVRLRPLLVPAVAILLMAAIPIWYTQWLPGAYVDVLTTKNAEPPAAQSAWRNLRSFPGHTASADRLYRTYLYERSASSVSIEEIEDLAVMATELPDAGAMPDELLADFWDRRTLAAMRLERRDDALLASLKSLTLSTPRRRNRSAMLVGEDYPLLLASLPGGTAQDVIFNPGSLLLTSSEGARVSQWSLGPDGVSKTDDWYVTALEVSPLVRRVIVDREGSVRRARLTLNISHARMTDLRIKLIAPSGRTVAIDPQRERASSSEDIRVPAAQLEALIGESMSGTWSISIRDEALGVGGYLAGWDLTLNTQGLVEDFQRGISIPDPVERQAEQFWTSADGRYAVARADRSDSLRLWDLAFAKPVSAVAVSDNEKIVGIDEGARRLVTATLDTINVWDTSTGKRAATLEVGPASRTSAITRDRRHLFVQHPGDVETRFEIWNLATGVRSAELVVAGSPALVSVDGSGTRIAVADYDRAARIWDLQSGAMLQQLDLPLQPSELELDAGGQRLGAVYGTAGLAVWSLEDTDRPLLESYGYGQWRLAFSESGARFAAGSRASGYRLYEARNGRLVGPAIGAGGEPTWAGLLAFNRDEDVIVTDGVDGQVRFWQMPVATVASPAEGDAHAIWPPSADAVVASLPGADRIAVGDRDGHVHFLAATRGGGPVSIVSEDISFLGHNAVVRQLVTSADGRSLASVGADNTIRVWDTESGEPRSFITSLSGAVVERVVFSMNGDLLAALLGNRAAIMSAESGEVLAELELGETHLSAAFGNDDALFLGSETGAINVLSRDVGGVWNLRRLSVGDEPIRWLEASPRGRYLLVMNGLRRAQLMNLSSGEPGALEIELPGAIEDVAFSPSESRVLFRSARWVHRASASAAGLIVLDSILVPKPLAGARIVFGNSGGVDRSTAGTFYLPVAREGLPYLAKYRFGNSVGPGLFGNRDRLIEEWRLRLGMDAAPAPSPAATAQHASQLDDLTR